MWLIFLLFCVLCLIPSALAALPCFTGKSSFAAFLISLSIVLVGIVVPLLVFLLSFVFIPEAKEVCSYGWLDCFNMGKLALTPMVLWAVASFYRVAVQGASAEHKSWVELGLFSGVIVSWSCVVIGVHGVLNASPDLRSLEFFMFIPVVAAVLYTVVFVIVKIRGSATLKEYGVCTLAHTPFWFVCFGICESIYEALPDNLPTDDCFVVTAAQRGHRQIVGRATVVQHKGRDRYATQQLATFWALELVWKKKRASW